MATGRLSFSVDIDGDRELSRTLHGYLGRMTDLRPLWAFILTDWQFTQQNLFMAEGAYEGQERWAELSKRYAAWKRRKYPGRGILVRTGAMREATTDPDAEITDTSLTITVDSPYAIYHQSSRPRTSHLPRRAFASLTGKQKSRWMGFLRRHLWEET